jgi:GNAT superfamily N-acetyltransferase
MDVAAAHLPVRLACGSARRQRKLPLLRARPIWIRDLRACDRPLLVQVHARLSPQSRTQRYLGPKPVLLPADVARLTAVDGSGHVALIALAHHPPIPVGIARYVRTESSETAEVAIEVIDAWQRRGVGRLLLAALRERALRAGIRRVTWTAFDGNRAAAALTRGSRDCRRTDLGEGVAQWSSALTR